MPLPLRPHTVTRLVRSDTLSGTNIVGTSRATGSTVRGHLVKLSPAQAFQQYGIETIGMGRWLQNVGASAWAVGDHFTIDGETWEVMTQGVLRNAEGLTAHEEYQVQRFEP